ncbi:histidine phosphatase family protein [Daejeonella lutea]|uniref:Histidine phosphatase superfamily (Branch 1) n=1 Tax=Daejeonella lutea TaxID=572036 RepID=A0A1T5ENH9_9SPHI|nr:histidine phosphatase family protein [Daejeonella lutea]SKB85522.1 Histidine phosphatase superfamily (branch 1) [Daejeonella lutea]
MNKHRIFTFILVLTVLATAFSSQAQTTVYIVRHAEKNMKDPASADPALSIDGQDRARDLATLLQPKRLLAAYATNSKSSKLTAEPSAYGHGVKVQVYDPTDLAEFASTVLRQHTGGAVLIVADLNNVLNMVEAFGIKSTMPPLNADDYNYLFAVTVNGDSTQLMITQYGKLKKTVK